MKRSLFGQVILLVILTSGFLQAQKNYTVSHYTSENGLPQNSIKTIFADPEGFVWLGTEDGLVRFDGRHFYIFNRFNLNISNNRVIFGRAVSKNKNPGKAGFPADSHLKDIYYASFLGWETVRIQNGQAVLDTLYRSRYSEKVAPFKKGPGRFHLATGLPNFVNDSTRLWCYMVTTGFSDKNFFVCMKDQVTYYADWKQQYTKKYAVNNLWQYFSIGEELFYYEREENRITAVSENALVTTTIPGDILQNPAYKTGKKNIELYWNNVSDQAFLRLDKTLYSLYKKQDGSLSTRLLIEDFNFAGEGIEQIYFDERSKKIFLGSPTEGLFVLTTQQFQVINIKGDARDNVFYAQVPYDENSVLTATGNVIGKDVASGRVTDRLIKFLNKINPSDKTYVMKDRRNTIWIISGTTLYHIDEKTKRILGQWSFKYPVNRIHEGFSGEIWISIYGEGLYRINPDDVNGKSELFVKVPFPEIAAIKSETATSLLIGTKSGLYRMDAVSRKCVLVKGTGTFHIKSIHVDNDKKSWFTASDKGILLLGEDDNFVVFPMDKNRYLASSHYIIDDKRGYFWIPTNKGLFQIAQKDLQDYAAQKIDFDKKNGTNTTRISQPGELFYMYHAKDEGFHTNEFNGGCDPCSAVMANGYISVPSLNGLVWFKPGQIENNMPNSRILLDKVEVDGRLLALSGDTVRFDLNPKNLRFHFSTAYFGNPYNLNLAYALVKANTEAGANDWIQINNHETDVRFSNLNSGEYTLLIRKVNGFGFQQYSFKKIHLIVPLRWYETWWAIALFVIVLAAAMYGYSRLRIRKIVKENAKLEALVNLRTEELSKTMLRLEDSKDEMSKKIHVLSRLLTSMTHDIQSPLNFVAITSSNIVPLIEADRFKEVGKIGEMIADSSKRMSVLLRDLLNYIRVNVYGNRLYFENIKLRPLVAEKLDMFRNMMKMNNTTFINNIPAEIEVNCDLQMVAIMIHNLVDNASKFTNNGIIEIYADVFEDHKVELVVANTTLGIPQHIIDMINLPAEENTDTAVSANKAGLGLLIVKEVSNLVGVSLRVTETDQTRFHLVFDN